MGITKKWILFSIAFFGTGALVILGGFLFLEDPLYTLNEAIFHTRYHRYDTLIAQNAAHYGVDPDLVRAVIWRESQFQPDIFGKHGERGLMQITEIAASDWAKAEKNTTFQPTDLFDPQVNIAAGSWRLAQALKHWEKRDDPVPFALAEYNAGRSRVVRWSLDSLGNTPVFSAEEMRARMDFPSTQAYVHAILRRYKYYQDRREKPKQ